MRRLYSTCSINNNENNEETHLASYLAGLFEGDGHISISKPGAKSNNLSLSITFHLKDLPLAEKLKEVTGFGWIRIKKEDNACVLTFHTIEGLIYIVSLMNFYLRTPKLKKFNELVDKLNTRYVAPGHKIEKYSYQTQDFSKDAWLAGFAEADGSFGIMLTKKEIDESGKTIKKRRVACRFRIEQRMICPNTNESYEPLLKNLAFFLNVNLIVVTRASGNQYFNITGKSRESLSMLKNYFKTYPLFGSKRLDYLDWLAVVNLILSQSHYEDKNLDLIEELKNRMNHNRNNLNWDHLSVLDAKKKVPLGGIINNKKYYSRNVKNNNLNSYLAGLFEGDGHIWIQNPVHAAGDKKRHNPRFCITFSLKNEPLAKKLLDIIESGFIRYKTKDNACVLVVSPVVGLKKIVYLINGELRTPKIHQLYKLIDWLNKHHATNIDKLPLKKGPLANDSWLSGFIDSDGSFSVQHTKVENNAKKRKISCRLRIEQRMLDPVTGNSYLDVLTNIAKFLNCSLLTRIQKSTDNEYYTLTASSKISTEILVNYLDRYSLFSSKYLDYKDWREIVLLILENKHSTEKGLTKTDSARSTMNRNRTYFNWDHLNKLSA
jgi:hypothetical protein